MAIALDIIKKKSGLDDTLAQQALDVKNAQGNEAFKEFVAKNKPVQAHVAGVPPAITPEPVQAPVDTTQFTQAPVDPITGLSKPLGPTVTPTVPTVAPEPIKDPEPVKTEKIDSVVDYNVSTGREGEIQDNISKITQTNPNLLKDRTAYNQAFGYETADIGKKALLDSTFNGQVKPSADQIFSSLKQGVSVGDPKSTEFRQAQARVNTFKKFSTYDTASLATSLSSGDLLVGTRAYNDLVSDPNMSAKIQKAQAFNKGEVNLETIGETQFSNIMASNPTVATALADNFLSKEEYDQLTDNDEVTAQLQKVEANKTKYETIKVKYDAVEDDVNSEFEGKEVTDSFKAKIVADRRKGMYKDYQIASLEYQNALGTYTNLKDDATALLGQNMELYKTQQAQEAQIASEQRQIQAQKDMMQYEVDFADKVAQESMNDPYKAIPAMIEEYKKLGIPFTRSTQQIIQDFESSGKDLATYLSELQGTIQSKPEYQRMQALQAGQGISYQTIGDKVYKQNPDGSLTLTNIDPRSAPTPTRPDTQVGTGEKPTGNIVPVTAGNKTVRLDAVGATGFSSAVSQLEQAGIPIVVAEGYRDQVETIKSMASRYGIAFNANNPAETAQKLRSAGHQVADPGKSEHENGMAIDVYGSGKLDAVTPAQEKILNANGWYSAGIPGDAGHFEYKGVQGTGTQGTPLGNLGQFMKDNQDRGTGYSNDDVKAFNEKIDRLVKEGDENGMALAYRNMVMKDKDFKKDFDDTQKFAKALDSVQSMITTYETAGKDTNALKKVAEIVGRKLGMTTDTALAQLQTQMGVTMANYIKSISGTAASDAEVARLMGNMANIGNVEELNTAIVSTVKQNAMDGIKSMIDTRMYGMPEELKPKVFGDIYGQSTTPQNVVDITKEKAIDLYNEWKSNR